MPTLSTRARGQPQRAVDLHPRIAGLVRCAVNPATRQVWGHAPVATFGGSPVDSSAGLARQGTFSTSTDLIDYDAVSAADKAQPMTFAVALIGWSGTTAVRVLTPSGTGWPCCALFTAYTAPNRYLQAQHRAADGTTITVTHPTVIVPDQTYMVAVEWVPGLELALYVDGVKAATATASTGAYASSAVNQLYVVGSSSMRVPYLGAVFVVGAAVGKALSQDFWAAAIAPERVWLPSSAGGATADLAATGGAQPGGSAGPSATIALAGVTLAQPGGAATPAASVALSETAIAIAGGSATASATVSISATGIALVAGSLNISAQVLLAAADGARAGGNPTLAALLSAMAAGGSQPGGSATPSGNSVGNLSESGGAQPGGSATASAAATLGASGGVQPGGTPVMSISVALVATDGAQSGGSATPSSNGAGDLSASGGAQPGGSAPVTATVELTAAGFVNVMTTGVLAVRVALSALDGARPGGSANPQSGAALLLANRAWTLPEPRRGWTLPEPLRRWELPQ